MQAPSEIINSLQSIAQQPRQDFLAALNVPNTLAANQLAQEKAAFYPLETAANINSTNQLASRVPSEIALNQAQASNIPFEQQQKNFQNALNIMRMRNAATRIGIDPDSLRLPDPMALLQGNVQGSMAGNQNVPPGIPQPSLAPLPLSQNQLASNASSSGGGTTINPDQANRLATQSVPGLGQIGSAGPSQAPISSNLMGENDPETLMKQYHDNQDRAQKLSDYQYAMGDVKGSQDILRTAKIMTPQQAKINDIDFKNMETAQAADKAATNMLQDVKGYNNLLKNMTKEQFSLIQRGKYSQAFSGNYRMAQHYAQDMFANAKDLYGFPGKMMTDAEMNRLNAAFGDPNQPLTGLQGNLRLITGIAQREFINRRMMGDHYTTHYTTVTYPRWNGDINSVPEHIKRELIPISPSNNDFTEPKE